VGKTSKLFLIPTVFYNVVKAAFDSKHNGSQSKSQDLLYLINGFNLRTSKQKQQYHNRVMPFALKIVTFRNELTCN